MESSSSDVCRIEKLQTAEQWITWKFQIKIILNSCDLYDVVCGDAEPLKSAKDGDLKEHLKADFKAQRIIVTSVGQQPLTHIVNCKTAREMWTKLITVYEQKSQTNIHMLQQKFYACVKAEKDDIATHISKVECIAQQLRDLGETVSESMLITKILMTLPDKYMHFHTAWESTAATDRTLSNLTSRLIIEETRMSLHTHTQHQNAFMAEKGRIYESHSSKSFSGGGSRGRCFICKKTGHWKRECPKKKNSKIENKNNNKDAFISTLQRCDTNSDSQGWFMDSGATDHMTYDRELFSSYEQFDKPQKVRVGNGELINAYGCGDVDILSYNNFTWLNKCLKKVLYVPEIKVNLFSSNSALDKGLRLVSNKDECRLLDGDKIVAVGFREKSLFRMMFEIKIPSANIATKIHDLKTWHERLAHQNIKTVKLFLKNKNIQVADDGLFCEACVFGKHSKLKFQASDSRAKQPGELVHSDLCGPMQHPSLSDSRYFLLFKDDFSKYRCVYFLKHKSEVPSCFRNFIYKLKSETGLKLKTIRTDNGTEFLNENFEDVLKQFGILHQTSVPYCPQQNGRAEREMRTLVEAGRTMIHAKNLPLELWPEAINTAAYVINRSALNDDLKTPFELWTGKDLNTDWENWKAFGDVCFVHVPASKRRKWDLKSEKGHFVGYIEGVKGYRIWVPRTNKIEVSRDVIFQKTIPEHVNEIHKKNEDSETTTVESNNILVFDDGDEPKQLERDESFHSAEDSDADDDEVPLRYRLRSAAGAHNSTVSAMLAGCAFVAESIEPNSFEEALRSRDASKWDQAMANEMDALIKNQTWELVSPPDDRKVIDNKWVYKIKGSSTNEPDLFKARLVVRGFSQVKGLDYEETFSPVARFSSIRTVFSLAAHKSYKIKNFDIKTAFLNGTLKENIFMKQPKGFEDGTGRVCKLQRSLYGLKQASRVWNEKFTSFLRSFHLETSKADPCVFVGNDIIMAIYIDDGIIAAKDDNKIQAVINFLRKEFAVKVFEAKFFLGFEIFYKTDGTIFINQQCFADKIVSKFGMMNANTVSTPADTFAFEMVEDNETSSSTNFPYRAAVGSLMYLAVGTRPDISYALGVVSRYMENPKEVHIKALKRIIRYVKGTRNYGIAFNSNSLYTFESYSDADYAGDRNTRRSTSGYICFLGDGPISWCSQQQRCVALSTTESEYIAAAEAAKEISWLKLLFDDIRCSYQNSTLFMDNQSAIRLVKNPEFHKRTKHVDVKYHFIREKYTQKVFDIEYVSTELQKADIFTKSLPKERFQILRKMIGVFPLSADSN